MKDNILTSLSPAVLRRAAEIRETMTSLEAELAGLVSGGSVTSAPTARKKVARKKKRASRKAAAAAPTAAAPKKKAARKGGARKKKAAAGTAKKKGSGKRKISDAGRARIREAQLKRWAAIRADAARG